MSLLSCISMPFKHNLCRTLLFRITSSPAYLGSKLKLESLGIRLPLMADYLGTIRLTLTQTLFYFFLSWLSYLSFNSPRWPPARRQRPSARGRPPTLAPHNGLLPLTQLLCYTGRVLIDLKRSTQLKEASNCRGSPTFLFFFKICRQRLFDFGYWSWPIKKLDRRR